METMTENMAEMSSSKSSGQRPKIQIPTQIYTSAEHKWQRAVRRMKSRFQTVCWHRRARKTTMALNILIENCCANRKGVYGYIGPTYKQTKAIAVTDPMMLKHYLPDGVCSKHFNESELKQEFKTGSVLTMKGADDPDSIRGLNFNGVILEEWAMMKHGRVIWEEIIQPILRENGGWAIFIFTPKGRNFAYEYFEKARRDNSGDWDYSLLKASQSGLITSGELAKAKAEMPERLFMQEFECEFLEDASSVFHNVDYCVSGDLEMPQYGRRYVLGADLGRVNDFTVLSVVDIGTNKLVAHQRFTDTSWAIQKEKIVLLAKAYNNAKIVIDATGFSAGSVIAEDLKEPAISKDLRTANLSVIPFKFTNQSKKALVEKLIVTIEQQLITFPNIEELVSELKSYTYEISQFGNVKYTAPEGMHDDCVISLGLAIYGLGSFVYAPLGKPKMPYSMKKQKRYNMGNI